MIPRRMRWTLTLASLLAFAISLLMAAGWLLYVAIVTSATGP